MKVKSYIIDEARDVNPILVLSFLSLISSSITCAAFQQHYLRQIKYARIQAPPSSITCTEKKKCTILSQWN